MSFEILYEPKVNLSVEGGCGECGNPMNNHKMDCGSKDMQPMTVEQYLAAQKECKEDEDWLAGVVCNPDAPEECESCQ